MNPDQRVTHTSEVRVRYGDTDQMGVVYYANYLRFFEGARADWLRAQGRSYREIEATGCMLPVVEAHAKYRGPARYDDLLHVDATVTEVRTASLRFDYVVRRADDGAELATGFTVHACMNDKGRACRLPQALVDMLVPRAATP